VCLGRKWHFSNAFCRIAQRHRMDQFDRDFKTIVGCFAPSFSAQVR
jgi:hypothetical protein